MDFEPSGDIPTASLTSDSTWPRRFRLLYQNWLLPFAIALLLAWALLLRSHNWYPPVGTYIAIVAVGAIVVTIWPPEKRWSKVAWILVFFLLVVLEIQNLYRDRDERETKERKARLEERKSFESVLERIGATIDTAKNGFDATLRRMEQLSRLSKENVDAATGGNGFVYIDVVPLPTDNNGAALWAIAHGKYPIRDVSYALTEGRPPYTFSNSRFNEMMKGTNSQRRPIPNVPAKGGQLLGHVVTPSLSDGGYYKINIMALNGDVNEKLEVKWDPKTHLWDRKITVTRNGKIVLKEGALP